MRALISALPVPRPLVPSSAVVPPLETITTSLVSLLGRAFAAWLFGSDGYGKANQVVDVEGSVNMSDVNQRVVGVAQDPVHFPDVDAVVSSNHDRIECRRGTFEVNEEPPLVTS